MELFGLIRVLQQLASVVAFVYTIHVVSPIPNAVFTWLMLLQVLRFAWLPLRFVAFAARLAYCVLSFMQAFGLPSFSF